MGVVMESSTIALFGEAEKGEFETGYLCHTLEQLVENLGNPPEFSRGLYYAIQTLLYKHDLLFFRVREEGFSFHDYLYGLQLLDKQEVIRNITALYIPGVGDSKIIQCMIPFCYSHHSILITTESDFYDYITDNTQ